MNKLRSQITNTLVVLTAISVPLLAADRYMRFVGLPKNNSRVMLLSGGKLESSKAEIRQYSPNSVIQHSAVYGNRLEYSYKFETDENGFRRTFSCQLNDRESNLVAITGDSFTEGQGSSVSWIRNVQENLCEKGEKSVNLAISGYGIEDMRNSLEYAYVNLGARKAIVAIIPGDIHRPYTPMISNERCSMYKSNSCGDSATWWHHPEGLDAKEIVEFARKKYDFGVIPVLKSLNLGHRLYLLASAAKQSIKRNMESSNYETPKIVMIKRSINAMNLIIERYGAENVALFILPTKNYRLSISSNGNKPRDIGLDMFLDSLSSKISVSDLRGCPLVHKHFYKIDGHPNEDGHELLGMCAAN